MFTPCKSPDGFDAKDLEYPYVVNKQMCVDFQCFYTINVPTD